MDPYLLAPPRMRCLINRSLLQDRHITLCNSNLGEPASQVQLTNSLFKFHSISPEPSPISHCLPQAAEQMPFSLLDCIEPCSRCSGILLRLWPPPPPSLGEGFQKKKKNTLAGGILAPYLILIVTPTGIRSTSSQSRIRELPLWLFVSAMVLWLLHWIGPPTPKKKKKGRGL